MNEMSICERFLKYKRQLEAQDCSIEIKTDYFLVKKNKEPDKYIVCKDLNEVNLLLAIIYTF